MKPLLKLWFLKTKGTIRNLFKSKTSGIFTIAMVLLYGGIIVSLFSLDKGSMMNVGNFDLHMSILILIGFLALMLFANMMQSKKALFYGEDAFYLFTGPFTRKQIMSYLTFQTILQALLIGFFALIILAAFGGGFTIGFIFMAYLASVITTILLLVLIDYLYVLSIGDQKYQKYAKIIPAIILGFVVVIVLVLYIQTGNLQTLFMDLVQSNLFYFVPVFGWMKLGLISFVEQNYLLTLLAYVLLTGALVLVYALFINYQGDFFEQALQDSLDFSKRMKAAKAGDQNAMKDNKIKHNIKSGFKSGAYAIMSKNMLLMRKTNSFISLNDLISIGIYAVVAIAVDMGIGMFVYMMVIWVFAALQNSDLAKELKNYQIYLIPDKPFRKLMAVIIPTFIKILLVTSVSFIAMGLFYHQSVMTILLYILNIISYTSIFISSSVLALRILKSRTSRMLENLMRMLVMILSAIPSAIMMIFIMINFNSPMALAVASNMALIVNFVMSFIILFACRNMMNGRELKSE